MVETTLPHSRYQTAAQEDRSGPRSKVQMRAALRGSGSPSFPIEIFDLSISGFSCEAVTSLRAGAICWVTFPGLTSLQAEVIWNDGIRVGCALSNLLAQPVLDRLIGRFGVATPG
jgi:hypothetical protein